MKMWKKTAVLGAVGTVMLLSGSMRVSAAGVRDVFDAKYYADTYSDLKGAFGDDAEALFQHYMVCGLKEGRSGSKVFDVAEYRSAYEDLEKAFGDDWDAYVNHYLVHGINEKRTAGVYGEIDLSKADDSAAVVPTTPKTPAASATPETPAVPADTQPNPSEDHAWIDAIYSAFTSYVDIRSAAMDAFFEMDMGLYEELTAQSDAIAKQIGEILGVSGGNNALAARLSPYIYNVGPYVLDFSSIYGETMAPQTFDLDPEKKGGTGTYLLQTSNGNHLSIMLTDEYGMPSVEGTSLYITASDNPKTDYGLEVLAARCFSNDWLTVIEESGRGSNDIGSCWIEFQ